MKRRATLQDDILSFCQYLSGRGRTHGTISAYRADLQHFAAWAEDGGLKDYLRPRFAELDAYLTDMREKGYEVASVARFLVALKAFYRFLEIERSTNSDPAEALETKALWDRIPEVLSRESVEKLLMAPRRGERFYLRDKALLETLYSSGGRVSEVVALRLDDLSTMPVGAIGSSRVVRLDHRALVALHAYIANGRDHFVRLTPSCNFVFVSRAGKALTREMVWMLVKKYAKRAGFTGKVGPQMLRNSRAAHLLADGANLEEVQELMGHQKVRTTKLYARAPARP